MSISKREKSIIAITVTVIVLALLYNFAIEPFFKKWGNINNQILIKRTAIKKDLRLLKNKNTIISEYNACAGSIKNISMILSYIEKKADSLGIKTENMKPRQVVQKEFYKEYVIELEIEATFSAINKFVSELLGSPTFITLKKFNLRTARETSSYFQGTLILSKLII